MKPGQPAPPPSTEGGGGAVGLYLFIRRYGMYVLLVAALGFLAFELIRLHATDVAREHQQAWLALRQAKTPQAIRATVLKAYAFPAVRARSYLKIGDWYLDFLNAPRPATSASGAKISRRQALAGAQRAFQTVLDHYAGQESLVITRAKLGLARVEEDAGHWTKAAAIYKAFLAPDATSMEKSFAALAAFRLQHLKTWARPPLAGPPVRGAAAPATTTPASPATRPKGRK